MAEFVAASDRGTELTLADGEPAGLAAWYRVGNCNEAKLDKLFVLQSRQRHGLGGQLIGRVVGRPRRVQDHKPSMVA